MDREGRNRLSPGVAGTLEHAEQTGVGVTAEMDRQSAAVEILAVERADSTQRPAQDPGTRDPAVQPVESHRGRSTVTTLEHRVTQTSCLGGCVVPARQR